MKEVLRFFGLLSKEAEKKVRVTKYRTIDTGNFRYLQYEKSGKWKDVPKPYFSRWGLTGYTYERYINHQDDIPDFIDKWLDIEDYLVYCEKEIKRKEDEDSKRISNEEARKGTIKYL